MYKISIFPATTYVAISVVGAESLAPFCISGLYGRKATPGEGCFDCKKS